MTQERSREAALVMDVTDPVSGGRDLFELPEDVIYLAGNSLGPPPATVAERLEALIVLEWGHGLVRSWNRHEWIDLAPRVAAAVAPLIGVEPDEVAVCDSTSVNLFKLLAAALRLRPGRRVILSETGNFGTDLYIAQGLVELLADRADLQVVDRNDLAGAMDSNVAVLMLTHVDFRTGEMHDMQAVTAMAHDHGALVLWDLAHSAGAVPVDLHAGGVDLAVGCGYKYLNGGPGAPAFIFAARRHHEGLVSPLWGWMGHDSPFTFDPAYRPAAGVGRMLVGTPPILSLAALQCGVESIATIGVDRLRRKSLALTDLFMSLVERRCEAFGIEIVTPRDPDRRGSQVALRHPEAHAIMQALIAAGIIGDFRTPDLMRFGFAPAYVRFVDVWDTVDAMATILRRDSWDRPEFHQRAKVT